jgi:hypothetical protein
LYHLNRIQADRRKEMKGCRGRFDGGYWRFYQTSNILPQSNFRAENADYGETRHSAAWRQSPGEYKSRRAGDVPARLGEAAIKK